MTITARALGRFTTRDLVLIAIMAALGIVVKPVVVPIAHAIAAPLFVPSGAFAGGLYMMWLVIAMGIVGKRGTATLTAFVQALLVIFTGVVGSHGAMSLVSYTAPGIIMDLGLLLFRHCACCLPCCVLAAILANVTGTLAVNLIFFRLPAIPLALTLCTAALSGVVGGVIAWEVIKLLRRYRIAAVRGRGTSGGSGDGRMGESEPALGSQGGDACVARGRGRRGRHVAPITIVSLSMLAAAAIACGCSGPRVGAVASPTSADPVSAHSIRWIDAGSGDEGTLGLAEVFAGPAADSGSVPLRRALSACRHVGTTRVAVYGADGSICTAPVRGCRLSAAGSLFVHGRSVSTLVGIVLDPPKASVQDVCRLAKRNLASGGKTLVIYLDGFGWDQFVRAKRRADIPRMARLVATKAKTVYPTITPVTFASMVSGRDPSATGIHDRATHRLSCSTIFDWAKSRGKSARLVAGDVQVLELAVKTVLDPDANGDGSTDDEVFASARRLLSSRRPDFMLVHFHGIDDVAHSTGPFSLATRDRTCRLDQMVGKLMDLWRGQVIVVADHGLHTVKGPRAGEESGAHGDFRPEDLFIPLLVGRTR